MVKAFIFRAVELMAAAAFIVTAAVTVYALSCGYLLVAGKGICAVVGCIIVMVVTHHYAESAERELRYRPRGYTYHPVEDFLRSFRHDDAELDRPEYHEKE